jgi:P27 family predicted phage terminase small subunit
MNPPVWLGKVAREYWRRIAKCVTVTQSNQDALALLCDGLDLYRTAKAETERDGITVPGYGNTVRPHPALAIQRQAFDQIFKSAKLLGLGQTTGQIQDELSEFLGGK